MGFLNREQIQQTVVNGSGKNRALDDAIRFECEADDAEKMAQVQHVIDSHVALFSRKAPLSVVWVLTP